MANEVNTFSKVYFLGIGGIGMSALARYFLQEGKRVAGYDRGDSDLTKELVSEGCSICFLDDPSLIPESFMVKAEVLVVYTPAVKLDNRMLQYFMAHDFTIMKRAEVLGLITQIAKSLCVAGTHGKSTTSSLLAHILSCSSIKFNAFLGAIATNFNSNIVLHKEAEYVVVEADEFDRSFLQLSPFSAIVTSVDPDHLDIYGSKESFLDGFKQFANKIDSNGLLVIKEGLSLQTAARKITYGLFSSTADYTIERLYFEDDVPYCDIRLKDDIWHHIKLGLAGIHNAENALACIALLKELDILSSEVIKEGLKSFLGLKRRFETILQTEKILFLDDYAHHPTEIDALIASIKMRYPNKKITGVFQPHLYSRTKDFAIDFARSLSALDEVILLPIYAARELPIMGISSFWLLNLIDNSNKKLLSIDELFDRVKDFENGIFVTIGAGDIDRIVMPIKEIFINNLSQK